MAESETKKRKREDTLEASDKNINDLLHTKRPDFPVSDKFLLLLSKSRPADISMGKREIITCQRTDPVSIVLQKLQDHQLSALPVLTSTNVYYGFIDMLDITRFVIDLIGETEIEKSEFEFENLPLYKNATVKDVMKYPISRTNPFQTVDETDSLLTVCEAMAKGYHRVGVLNEQRELVQVLSQSAVIKWIHSNLETLGAKAKMQVKYMDCANQYVVSALHDEKAIDAFKILKVCKVTGIALINDDGTLMGSLSASDLKKIHSSAKWISRLFQPVSTFVQYHARKKQEPLSVTLGHDLVQVLKKFVNYKVHRLFVVDEKNEPIGVVAMTDLIKTLLQPN